jgi:tetratricopeptide (TPR) repeat protein
MTKTKFHAVILAVAVAVGGVSFTTQALAAQAVSAAVAVPLKAANDAVRAQKWEEALTHLREVNGIAGKTAYDTYVMNQLMGFALVRSNKYAEAATVMEAQLGSSIPTASEKTQINKQLLGIYFNLKNYPKVIELGQTLVNSGAADATTYNVIAQAYDRSGKLPDAVKFVKGRVDSALSHGQKPAENDLLLLLDYQRRLKDLNGQTETFEKLVSYYPKASYWENIIPVLLNANDNTDAVTVNIYRLMYSTGTLKRSEDYAEMAKLAIVEGAAGEAVVVLQSGIAANLFPEDRKAATNRLLESAKKQLAADQAALPKAEADAKASKTGDADLRVGKTYYGLGQYDKAVEAYKRGIAKGGLKSNEEAQILLGIALLHQKKNAEATTAFKAVKAGGDAKFVRLANLWALAAK